MHSTFSCSSTFSLTHLSMRYRPAKIPLEFSEILTSDSSAPSQWVKGCALKSRGYQSRLYWDSLASVLWVLQTWEFTSCDVYVLTCVCVCFNPLWPFTVPQVVKPARLVKQRAELFLTKAVWGENFLLESTNLLLFFTCKSLLSCRVGTLGYVLEEAIRYSVSPQEGLQAEIGRGPRALRSLPAVRRVGAGSMGRWHFFCCCPMAGTPQSRASTKPLTSFKCPRQGWVNGKDTRDCLQQWDPWVPWRASHMQEERNFSLSINQSNHVSDLCWGTCIPTDFFCYNHHPDLCTRVITLCFHQEVKYSKLQSSELQKTALFTSVPRHSTLKQ